MSGHEKFYIPHDDLQELKTAIESLETDIETLDTTIQDTLKERYEEILTDTYTLTGANDYKLMRNAVVSATKDVFIRRVHVGIYHATTDPLTNFDSDIALGIGVNGGVLALAENIFGDSNRCLMRTLASASTYYFYRTWYINDCKIAANTNLIVEIYCGNMAVGTQLTIITSYVEDVYG